MKRSFCHENSSWEETFCPLENSPVVDPRTAVSSVSGCCVHGFSGRESLTLFPFCLFSFAGTFYFHQKYRSWVSPTHHNSETAGIMANILLLDGPPQQRRCLLKPFLGRQPVSFTLSKRHISARTEENNSAYQGDVSMRKQIPHSGWKVNQNLCVRKKQERQIQFLPMG